MHLRAFLADADPLPRQRLRAQLASYPDVEVVGEEADGQRVRTAVRALTPDLLFLDVPLPGLDGFGLLSALEEDGCRPAPIFVTASERYALRAFEFHAVDYL